MPLHFGVVQMVGNHNPAQGYFGGNLLRCHKIHLQVKLNYIYIHTDCIYTNCGYISTNYSVPCENLHVHGYVLTRAVESILQCEIVSLVNQTDKQQENCSKKS